MGEVIYEEVKARIERDPAWGVFDRHDRWYCPVCGSPTSIRLPAEGECTEIFVKMVMRHLDRCSDPARGKQPLKTAEDLRRVQAEIEEEGRLVREIIRRIATGDPRFLCSDSDLNWICPHCMRPIPEIRLASGVLTWHASSRQIARHFLKDCPVVKPGDVTGPPRGGKDAPATAASSPPGGLPVSLTAFPRTDVPADRDPVCTEEIRGRLLEEVFRNARRVQARMLPSRVPERPGYEFARHYRSCDHLGGDFYDFIDFPDGRIGIVIGDVAGHGVEASLIMGMVKMALGMRGRELADPGEVIRKVNGDIRPALEIQTFITCCYAILDSERHHLWMARAGHDYPLFYHAADDRVEEIQTPGMAIGLLGGDTFDRAIVPVEATLEPGDSLIVYTDGLVELNNPQGEEFGHDRFCQAIRQHGPCGAGGFIESLIRETDTFRGGCMPQDDITLVVIRRKS
ncbi:MAG: PP2C family protein-serine/threonine phosphatase [Planctomycetota bacterium]